MTADIWIMDYNPPRCFQKKISGRGKHNDGWNVLTGLMQLWISYEYRVHLAAEMMTGDYSQVAYDIIAFATPGPWLLFLTIPCLLHWQSPVSHRAKNALSVGEHRKQIQDDCPGSHIGYLPLNLYRDNHVHPTMHFLAVIWKFTADDRQTARCSDRYHYQLRCTKSTTQVYSLVLTSLRLAETSWCNTASWKCWPRWWWWVPFLSAQMIPRHGWRHYWSDLPTHYSQTLCWCRFQPEDLMVPKIDNKWIKPAAMLFTTLRYMVPLDISRTLHVC
jgi:hypothetical protein